MSNEQKGAHGSAVLGVAARAGRNLESFRALMLKMPLPASIRVPLELAFTQILEDVETLAIECAQSAADRAMLRKKLEALDLEGSTVLRAAGLMAERNRALEHRLEQLEQRFAGLSAGIELERSSTAPPLEAPDHSDAAGLCACNRWLTPGGLCTGCLYDTANCSCPPTDNPDRDSTQ